MNILLLILILNEFFFIFNRDRLNLNFRDKNISDIKNIDIFYYIIKFISYIFPFFVLFTPFKEIFVILMSINIIHIFLYYFNKKSYIIYGNIMPILRIVTYSSILIYF